MIFDCRFLIFDCDERFSNAGRASLAPHSKIANRTSKTSRRTGATLVEVLVAIFVMGIGLLALLTLFPLGALSMYRAIQKDRAVQAEVSASAIAAALSLRQDLVISEAMEGRDATNNFNQVLPPLAAS